MCRVSASDLDIDCTYWYLYWVSESVGGHTAGSLIRWPCGVCNVPQIACIRWGGVGRGVTTNRENHACGQSKGWKGEGEPCYLFTSGAWIQPFRSFCLMPVIGHVLCIPCLAQCVGHGWRAQGSILAFSFSREQAKAGEIVPKLYEQNCKLFN
jgi:hypothetical protein